MFNFNREKKESPRASVGIEDIIKKPENKKFFDKIFESSKFGRLIKPVRYYALALMLSMSPLINKGQNNIDKKDSDKNKLEDTGTIKSSETMQNDDKNFHMGGDFRFSRENKDGNEVFNPGGLVAPISIEFNTDISKSGQEIIDVPMIYAEDFDNTGFTNEGDKDAMDESFKDQINKNFINSLTRILEPKGVYNANHEGEDNLLKNPTSENKITSIKITGFASPEASTAESIIPGNKEEKNENLAKKRAEIARAEIEKIIKENKIDESVLDSINYEEVQFSDVELDKLTNLAESLGIKGSAPEDQIIELISMYNDGVYNSNDSVKKIMDEVVGSKRGVTIEIDYEGKEKKQVVVPIPLLLLLLLSKRIRKGLNPYNWKRNDGNIVEGGKKEDEDKKKEEEKYINVIHDEDKVKVQEIEKPVVIIPEEDKNIEKIEEEDKKEDNGKIIDEVTPVKVVDKIEEEKILNEISQEEYDGTYDDLKMLNKRIQESKGIITLEESSFKSEYGRKRYLELKSIQGGIPVRFNKEELQKIGDELEGLLSNSRIISKEEMEERVEREKKNKSMAIDMSDDLKMLNKRIQESKGIITLEESDFKSEYGRKRYLDLKSIQGRIPVRFNKDELQKIGDEMEGYLINFQKSIKSGRHEKESNVTFNQYGEIIRENK